MLGERHLLREMRQVDFQSIEWRKPRSRWPSTEVFVFMRDPGSKYKSARAQNPRSSGSVRVWGGRALTLTHTHALQRQIGKDWGISIGPERQFIWNKHSCNVGANAAVLHSKLFTDIQLNCEGKLRRCSVRINSLLKKIGGISFKEAIFYPHCHLLSASAPIAWQAIDKM